MQVPPFRPFSLGLAATALSFTALAQDIEQASPAEIAAGQPAPVPAQSRAGDAPLTFRDTPQLGLDGGAVITRPSRPSDALPLPVERQVIVTPDGEQVLQEASGDPYFLGFVGGDLRPAAGERVDPRLIDALAGGHGDARPEPVVYAFAMFSKRITRPRLNRLEEQGVRFLGFHPHQAMKVAVDLESLAVLEASEDIHWIGLASPTQKLHPELEATFLQGGDEFSREIIVNVFEDDRGELTVRDPVGGISIADPGGVRRESDENLPTRWQSNGWQQAQLEAMGLKVREYLPTTRSFLVEADAAQVAELSLRDFVLFIEPYEREQLAHDDSAPMVNADYVRNLYDGSTNNAAIAGAIDSGIDIAHEALDGHYYLGWTYVPTSVWTDECGHGSHVDGTILGRPNSAEDDWTGMAPRLGFSGDARFRHVKMFRPNPDNDNKCQNIDGVTKEQNFSFMRDAWISGDDNSPKPHVINNSYGTGEGDEGAWIGSEFHARAVDSEVFEQNQVYVFAAHNHGPDAGTLSQEGSAKNAIVVGNVVPYESGSVGLPGNLWTSSSRGPCGDGRWKPNVVAPGTAIKSVDAHTGDGYDEGTGTSMASPHVTGIVAQMVDRHSFLRYQPARVASLLMATAHTKDDVALTGSGNAHLDEYGAGRADAYAAVFTDSQRGWLNWGFTQSAGNDSSGQFTLPQGTERVVVVMHYIEEAASAGASQALINDFDLRLESPGGVGYSAHQSSINTTEIRYINNPEPGTWEWETLDDGTSSNVRMSVTAYWIVADTSPSVGLSLSVDDQFVQPGETVEVTASVTNNDYIASALFLDTSSTNGATLTSAEIDLLDGVTADLTDNLYTDGGFEATLGNLRYGHQREVRWEAHWDNEGVKTWSTDVTGDNTSPTTQFTQVQITVDGTQPGQVFAINSSSHDEGVWSNDDTIDFTWIPASDNLSGIDGYGTYLSPGSPSIPAAVKDQESNTQATVQASTSSLPYYFNVRSVDNSGNWDDDYNSGGPYYIDTLDPETVTGLVSTSHLTNTWTANANVTVQWFAADDAHSGIDGYGIYWSVGQPSGPGQVKDIEAVTQYTEALNSSLQPYYFNIRSLDNAGNWDSHYTSAGPLYVDAVAPTVNLLIANEVAALSETTTLNVPVIVTATDEHSGVTEMRLKNDAGIWSAWIPYDQSFNWNLQSGGGGDQTGTRTLQIEVRDQAGNVSGDSYDILYYVPATRFGEACDGTLGKPEIGSKGIFQLGKSAKVTINNTDAVYRELWLGFSKDKYLGLELPLDLALVNSPGCFLNVSRDQLLYGGNGEVVEIAVPLDQNLADKTVYLQWLLFGDSSGKLIIGTEGLEVHLNGE